MRLALAILIFLSAPAFAQDFAETYRRLNNSADRAAMLRKALNGPSIEQRIEALRVSFNEKRTFAVMSDDSVAQLTFMTFDGATGVFKATLNAQPITGVFAGPRIMWSDAAKCQTRVTVAATVTGTTACGEKTANVTLLY